ncbi:phage Gp37/Gp68 family protein [Christensenellaceae bacterium OttesenSCG-928-K19]|nr:phage Gp37/Gp68 family protein [Christensenellaceae bacterium OttesenSCG-928-K19]
MNAWNPWHGCHKISPGCKNCYMHRRDDSIGIDGNIVRKTKSFDLPVKRDKEGKYKLQPQGELFTCGTSDFFVEEADEWRQQAWQIMKERADIDFLILTKRIHRFAECLPPDWGDGYDNVRIGCTVENQDRADYRLPIFLATPIKRRAIICEPILEELDLSPYLQKGKVDEVVAGGESGWEARPCRYEWILKLQQQCVGAGVGFWFKQTGRYFIKDGKQYTVLKRYQHAQARKAGINHKP